MRRLRRLLHTSDGRRPDAVQADSVSLSGVSRLAFRHGPGALNLVHGDRTLILDAVLLRDVATQVRNLSAGGCLLETRAYLPVGTVGVLDVELDGERRLEWFRICRIQGRHGGSGAYFVGAEFLPLAVAGDHSLRGAVRRMPYAGAPRGMSGLAGRLSGDLGKFLAFRAAIPPATDTSADFSQQVVQVRRAAASADVGSQVAESGSADAPNPRKSDEGEVHMKRLIARLVRDDQGQDLIEYILIGSFVSIGALAGATALGTQIDAWYTRVSGWVAGVAV